MTRIILQDELINLNQLTEKASSSPFTLEMLPKQPYEKDREVQQDVTLEMNLNQRLIYREGYTALDYISDIGGMQGMLISLMAFILGILNFNYFDNHIVEKMFKVKPPADPGAPKMQGNGFFKVKKEATPLKI